VTSADQNLANSERDKYESHIAGVEERLAECQDIICDQTQQIAEVIERHNNEMSQREANTINVAMNYIAMCQKTLSLIVVGGPDGIEKFDDRELKPEEGAAFSAACDMLSRVFDSEFQYPAGRGPEAEE